MAHDFAMKLVGNPTTPLKDMMSIIDASWKYADAMRAEADKRKEEERGKLYDPMRNIIDKKELSKKSIETVMNADLSKPMELEDVTGYHPFMGNGYIDPLKTDDKTCKHELRDLGKYRTCMVCDYIEEVEND